MTFQKDLIKNEKKIGQNCLTFQHYFFVTIICLFFVVT
jgi:hypothetical protein